MRRPTGKQMSKAEAQQMVNAFKGVGSKIKSGVKKLKSKFKR